MKLDKLPKSKLQIFTIMFLDAYDCVILYYLSQILPKHEKFIKPRRQMFQITKIILHLTGCLLAVAHCSARSLWTDLITVFTRPLQISIQSKWFGMATCFAFRIFQMFLYISNFLGFDISTKITFIAPKTLNKRINYFSLFLLSNNMM